MSKAGVVKRYWDSFCFIALLNDDEGAEDCEKILDDAKEGKTIIIVSPLVQVEVIRPKGSPIPIPIADKERVQAFFENDYIKWRNIDRSISNSAQGLCWAFCIHPRDALHVAIAIDTDCDILETTDDRLLKLPEKMKGMALKIVKPKWVGQTELFVKKEVE